jgi:hypothetical protein
MSALPTPRFSSAMALIGLQWVIIELHERRYRQRVYLELGRRSMVGIW